MVARENDLGLTQYLSLYSRGGNPYHAAEGMARYEFAAKFLGGAAGRALDLGCGSAVGFVKYFEAGLDVVGVDSHQEVIAYNKKLFPAKHAEFLAADATRLKMEGGQYDLVSSFDLIEHLEEPKALLDEMRRMARPGGVMVVGSPNTLRHMMTTGKIYEYHIREYTPSEFIEEVRTHWPEAEFYGQNPFMLDHFREGLGMFRSPTLFRRLACRLGLIEEYTPKEIKEGQMITQSRLEHCDYLIAQAYAPKN